MGDRCWLTMRVRASQEETVERECGCPNERIPDETDGTVELIWHEANYGFSSELAALTKRGVVFVGSHTAGGDYGPCVFAAVGGKMLEMDADMEGNAVVAIDMKTGLVPPSHRESAVRFVRLWKRALGALVRPTGDGSSGGKHDKR